MRISCYRGRLDDTRSTSLRLSPCSSLRQKTKQQVDALLASEPDNVEYVELKSGLLEVISLTKDLLAEAVANEGGAGGGGGEGQAAAAAVATATKQPAPRKRKSRWEEAPAPDAAAATAATAPSSETTTRGAAASAATTTTTAAMKVKLAPPPLVLPPSSSAGVNEEERQAAAPGEQDELDDDSAEARYQAPELPKRRGALPPASAADAAAIASEEMPKWLEIKPGDDEKEIERKKKKQKAWKSKRRLATRDLEAREKQASWQAFAKGGVGGGGGKKKKVAGVGASGTAGGGSIYSVPAEDPLRRVGVVAAPKRTE